MKNLKSIAAIIFLSTFITTTSKAQINSTLNNNFSVKYIGIEGNYVCFLVEIKEVSATDKILKISDKVEGELYAENWNIKSTLQKFKIEKKDTQVLIFNLSAGNKEYKKTYSFSTKLTENTVVKEEDLVML
jgi:hypothetical protein